jgi:DNA recombination protein RmuC
VALLLLLHRSRSDNARLRAAAEETKSLADRQAVEIEHATRALQKHAEDLAEARQRHGEAERARALAQEECARLQEAERRLESAGEDARQAIERLTDRHDGLQRAHAELQSAHAALQADTDGKLASAEREVKALKDLRDELSRRFEELANATLRRTSEDFSRSHAEKLNELLTPFREHVGRFEAELRNVHKSADEERARLGEQIRQLTQRSEAISVEATNLTRALKGDKQRQGAWGEMILEGVLEASGLIEGLHYDRRRVTSTMRARAGGPTSWCGCRAASAS